MIDAHAAFGHEGELDEKPRRFDEWMRAGVNFAQRAGAFRMCRKAEHRAVDQRFASRRDWLMLHSSLHGAAAGSPIDSRQLVAANW